MTDSDIDKNIPEELKGRIPTLQVIAMPKDQNSSGDIFGGWILAQMDLAGADAALSKIEIDYKYEKLVTRAINSMEFHKPVLTGDKVCFYTSLFHMGNTSIAIKVESWAIRRKTEKYVKVTEGLFTFVKVKDMKDGRRSSPIGSK